MSYDTQALLHWSDDHLVVINKPAGLRSIPDGYDPGLPHVRSVLEPLLGRLWIVHRLDKNTSGLMMLARSAVAHRELNIQFDESKIYKLYHAVIEGHPSWSKEHITLPLLKDGDRRHRTVIDHQRGKRAQTDIKVLTKGDGRTLVAARPFTGRTHQIRAHLAAVGHPVTGDRLYGYADSVFNARLALHAKKLGITHPITSRELHFEIPDPEDFKPLLRNPQDQIKEEGP
jgi:tRNA pseudouridine32 synthase/23S rRNA pseudouridine746 synthase